MVTRSGTVGYQQSSESGRERMVKIPYARLTDQTPTIGDPAQITGLLPGAQMTGTVITVDAVDSEAMINRAEGAVYRHNVRTVLTYNGGNAEATWGVINIGDPVYYDLTSDANHGVKLSTSPLQGDAATANARFGTVIMLQSEDADDFAKAAGAAGNTHLCAVDQAGVGES